MRIEQAAFHCLDCAREWLADTVLDAPIEVWSASVRALSCPACGAGPRRIAFGRGDVPDPQPIQAGMTDPERRTAWLKMCDHGLSSRCIADVMCGITSGGEHPRDPDDFGRCERLLILYPEWRARLPEMRAVSPVWAALIDRWADIEAAWRHDVALARSKPKARDGWACSPLMRSIIDAATEARND